MKKVEKSKFPKFILVLSVSGLIAAGLYFAYALSPMSSNDAKDSNSPTEKQLKDESKANSSSKQEFIDSTTGKDVPGTTVTPPSTPDAINATASVEPGMVVVQTKFKDVSSGSCTLTATNGDKRVVKSVNIIYQPEFSTCAGFSIVIGDLGVGRWDISIDVAPDGGSVLTKSIEVNVQ